MKLLRRIHRWWLRRERAKIAARAEMREAMMLLERQKAYMANRPYVIPELNGATADEAFKYHERYLDWPEYLGDDE